MFRTTVALSTFTLIGLSCQRADFEPVQPSTIVQTTRTRDVAVKKLKPNLMLLVDKSGSMKEPVSGTSGPTRMDDLRTAMADFLGRTPTKARFGLTLFPATSAGDQCQASNSVAVALSPPANVEDEALDVQQAQAVLSRLQSTEPSGGTPTTLSLRYVSGLEALQDPARPNFVLLLTDGEPNCNPGNPVDCTNPTACRCTIGTSCGDAVSAPYCRLGCLDDGGAVQAVLELRAKNLKTFVVGFGAATAGGQAATTLNALAEAGGFVRGCPHGTTAECGGGACDQQTHRCATQYYQARNGAELAGVLTVIGDTFGPPPCVWPLDNSAPGDPALIVVSLGDRNLPMGPDSWMYEETSYLGGGGKAVVFKGESCRQIEASTPGNPVHVEIRALEQL